MCVLVLLIKTSSRFLSYSFVFRSEEEVLFGRATLKVLDSSNCFGISLHLM